MGLVSRWVRLGAAGRPSSISSRAFLVPAVDSSAVREIEQDGLVRARDLRERKEPPLAQKTNHMLPLWPLSEANDRPRQHFPDMEGEDALHDLAEGIEHSNALGKLLSRHETVLSNAAGARPSRVRDGGAGAGAEAEPLAAMASAVEGRTTQNFHFRETLSLPSEVTAAVACPRETGIAAGSTGESG